MPEHPQQARARLRYERFDRGRAGLFYGREDPAAFCQNLEIWFARHFHLEFIGAVASPNDVGVRVHKTRHEDAVARVEHWFVGIRSFQFRRRTHRHDLFIAHNNGTVFDDPERAKGFAALRSACESEELGGGMDKHGGKWLLVISNRRLETGDLS